MHSWLKTNTAIIAALLLISLLACEQAPPKPAPTPVPIEDVEDVYSDYQREKAANSTRLKARIESKEIRAFRGVVDRIDGSKLQFLYNERFLDKDQYLECKFDDESDVLRFNTKQEAQVVGRLDGANGVVKFTNCRGEPVES